MTTKEAEENLLMRFGEGFITSDEILQLIRIYSYKYKLSKKDLHEFITWQSFNELYQRLKSSVFSDEGQSYPEGYKIYCIQAEYHNTKLFIETTKKFISISYEYGDITKPEFYGQPDPGFKISYEALVHIILRHNQSINSFINKDSIKNGYSPSSFGFGVVASSIMIMFMALNILKDHDWKKATTGKNLICHFSAAEQVYTLIRKGSSRHIITFYTRNDSLETTPVKLKRHPEQMRFVRDNES